MHVVCLILFSLLIIGTTYQFPQNGSQEKNVQSSTTGPVTNATTTEVPIYCETVRKVKGLCIIRGLCDYGPGNIDFTLYETRSYRRPCRLGYACCPFKFQQEKKEEINELDNFDFDDDD